MAFHKIETNLPGVWMIKPDVFSDHRGFFTELYQAKGFEEIGLGHLQFVQDNLSSSGRGTLRGMHFQSPPSAQGKLVTVLQGRVLDVAVDIRKDSPNYGDHVAIELDAGDLTMLYIPVGFAHGFQVLSERCLFSYKCTNFYDRSAEGGLPWDDPDLALPWRDIPPIISDKDKAYGPFKAFETPF